MTYHVKAQAISNGLTGFYVYDDEAYVAGPWIEAWQASYFIETLTDGRYMAKADRTAVMRGRRSDGKLVLRDDQENQPRDVGGLEDDLVRRASRRDVLLGALTATVAAGMSRITPVQAKASQGISSSRTSKGARSMSMITTKDGTEIYYKDWGTGPVVTFSHGWPLNADAWDGQMLFLAQNGFRVVAHDRRGHGRSSQTSSGNDMNGYADDLAAVIEALDLKDATLVGHSTGGGEVARYIGRHGTGRVAKAVLIAAVPPIMLKSDANPEGLPMEVFDSIRAGVAGDRSQFYKDLALAFYGANRPGAKVSQGTLDQFWLWSMQAGAKNAYESVKAFSETDFSEDLKKFDVPTLVLHGEDDQIVPVKDSARKSAKLIKGAREIYYPGAPHGITATHQDQVNAELLAFIRS